MSADRARIQAVLPDYDVGEEIADSAVYRARERKLGEDRVVTVLASFGPGLAAPEHPHIVRIHEYVGHEELWIVVTEYVPGGSLADREDSTPEQVCA